MKMMIEKITRTDVEVEIPDVCPECGQVFAEGGIDEDNWNGCQVHGHIQDSVMGTFEANGSSDFTDAYIVVGYRCQCGHVLASTEEEVSS